MLIVYDANGMRWTWDRERGRVYCIDDMPETEEELAMHGYECFSWAGAIRLLNEYGYMEA